MTAFDIPGVSDQAISMALDCMDELKPFAVYLFGSAVRGELRQESDIDLAVLAEHQLDPLAILTMAGRLEDAFGRPVDLVDLRSASTVMAKQVVSTGRLLQDSNTVLRARFEMHLYADYARLNEERLPVLASLAALQNS